MRQILCEQEKIIKGNKRSKEISQVELLHVNSLKGSPGYDKLLQNANKPNQHS